MTLLSRSQTRITVKTNTISRITKKSNSPTQNWQQNLENKIYYILRRPGKTGVEYCDQSFCVSVCPRAYLWNRWTDLDEILCTDHLWPWLGPALVALRYVMCFRFYWWRHVSGVAIPGRSVMSMNALLFYDMGRSGGWADVIYVVILRLSALISRTLA